MSQFVLASTINFSIFIAQQIDLIYVSTIWSPSLGHLISTQPHLTSSSQSPGFNNSTNFNQKVDHGMFAVNSYRPSNRLIRECSKRYLVTPSMARSRKSSPKWTHVAPFRRLVKEEFTQVNPCQWSNETVKEYFYEEPMSLCPIATDWSRKSSPKWTHATPLGLI